MSAAVLISMAEYLDTSYSPDREYVDGAVVERHRYAGRAAPAP